MTMNGPYTAYVIAAYGISAALLVSMVWRTWSSWRQAQKNWQIAKKLTHINDEDA